MSLSESLSTNNRPQNAAAATVDETLDWARFATARRAGEFCQAWLSLQCRQVPGVVAALLLIDDDDGGYAPAAIWPENAATATDLVPTARQALKDRRGVLQRTIDGEAHAAYPFDVAGKLSIKGVSQDVIVPVALAQTGTSTTASGTFAIKRLDFKIGEGDWKDTSMVANDVQVRFKLLLTGIAAM